MSENGWTDDFLCKEWFKNNFIPQTAKCNISGKLILLIYDGHGSHETFELIDLACKNNIILFCLSPHTTHRLQPLDVGVFGPFACAWAERCDEIVEDTGAEMPCKDFVKEYMEVRHQTFKSTTIITAFRKSGCWPIDPNMFTEDDFAPSIPTSTSARHVPNSFPFDVPSNLGDDASSEGSASDSSSSEDEMPGLGDQTNGITAIVDSETPQTQSQHVPVTTSTVF